MNRKDLTTGTIYAYRISKYVDASAVAVLDVDYLYDLRPNDQLTRSVHTRYTESSGTTTGVLVVRGKTSEVVAAALAIPNLLDRLLAAANEDERDDAFVGMGGAYVTVIDPRYIRGDWAYVQGREKAERDKREAERAAELAAEREQDARIAAAAEQISALIGHTASVKPDHLYGERTGQVKIDLADLEAIIAAATK